MSTHGGVPIAPNESHPAYADNSMVHDWVNRVGSFAHLTTLRQPVGASWRLSLDEPDVSTAHQNVHVLDLHTCWGLAPYVGRPFVYAWRVAVDELGRMVAGEAWRQYLDAA